MTDSNVVDGPQPLSDRQRVDILKAHLNRADITTDALGVTTQLDPMKLMAPGGRFALSGVGVGVFALTDSKGLFRVYTDASITVLGYPLSTAAFGKPALVDYAIEVKGGSGTVRMNWKEYPADHTVVLGSKSYEFTAGLHHAPIVPNYPKSMRTAFAVTLWLDPKNSVNMDVLFHYCEVTPLK